MYITTYKSYVYIISKTMKFIQLSKKKLTTYKHNVIFLSRNYLLKINNKIRIRKNKTKEEGSKRKMKGKKIIIALIIINILTIGIAYNFIKKDYLNSEKIIVKAMTEIEYEDS